MRTFIFKSLLLSSLLFAGLSANAQGPFPMFNNHPHLRPGIEPGQNMNH